MSTGANFVFDCFYYVLMFCARIKLSDMSRTFPGRFLESHWTFLGHVPEISLTCRGHFPQVYCTCPGHILDFFWYISRTYLGQFSKLSREISQTHLLEFSRKVFEHARNFQETSRKFLETSKIFLEISKNIR